MKNITKLLPLYILALAILFACGKSNWDNPEDNNSAGLIESIEVPVDFDWATTQKVSLNFVLPEDDTYRAIRVYTQNEEELLFIGYAKNNNTSLLSEITIPSYISIVKVYYGFADKYVPFEIGVDEEIYYDFNQGFDLLSQAKNLKADDCGCEGGLRSLTMKYNGDNPATIQVKEKKGNEQIFFQQTVNPGEEFTFTGSKGDGKMDKTIYFYINGDKDATMHTSCSVNLYKGDEYGSFTIVSGFSKDELPLCDANDECGCEGGLVTMKLRYKGSSAANVKVNEKGKGKNGEITVFNQTVQPDEDFSFTGTKKDGRLDNTIYVYVDNVKNTEIHTSCSVVIEVGDTYGDFVIASGTNKNNLSLCGSITDDPGPDPPDDPNPPGNNTSITFDGTLAYEDLWPSKGDYDFNDLVINYEFVVTKNSNEEVLNINAAFTVYAFGASFHNGFGFQLPNVLNNHIISVSGYQIESDNLFSLNNKGLENGQSKATIIVYDDSYNLMAYPGSGIGVNTTTGATYVTPVTVNMDIVFYENESFGTAGALSYSELDIGNFNPFIIVNANRDVEVHLPDYPPTNLADETRFNTFNDKSIPTNGIYYKSNLNLPWAINIPIVFEYPLEKQEIVKAYLKFAEWAESSGQLFTDWYLDNTEYRNSTFIYKPSN